MFWNNFVKLCVEHNTKPNPVAKALDLSSGSVTKWKNGATPNDTTLKKIADYFGVEVSALTTDTPEPLPTSAKSSPFLATPENEKESRLLLAYRSQPEMQPAVDRILGITDDGNITLYTAAKSSDNIAPQTIEISQKRWEEFMNTPKTDSTEPN